MAVTVDLAVRAVLATVLSVAATLKWIDVPRSGPDAWLVWIASSVEAVLALALFVPRLGRGAAACTTLLGFLFAGYHAYAIAIGVPDCICLGAVRASHVALLPTSIAIATAGLYLSGGSLPPPGASGSGR